MVLPALARVSASRVSRLRISCYPVIDGENQTVASLVPHTDSGFMTLLPPNRVPGLSILLPSGRWMDAPGVEGAYVVNGGDILYRWTNERFLSTPHRVRNVSGQVRYAIPFFCDPDHDMVIEWHCQLNAFRAPFCGSARLERAAQ